MHAPFSCMIFLQTRKKFSDPSFLEFYEGSGIGRWSTWLWWQHMWCSPKHSVQWGYFKCVEPQCIRPSGLFARHFQFSQYRLFVQLKYLNVLVLLCIPQAVMALRDSIKRHLKLPSGYVMEYKPHDASLRDNSSYRNTWLRG